MRYTRYNYKRKRNNNDLSKFILKLAGTVIGAGVCGILLAYIAMNILSKNNTVPVSNNNESVVQNSENTTSSTEQTNNTTASNTTVFYAVQSGYFSNESNANQILNSLNGKYSAFIYEDEGKFRVLSGIYQADKVDSILNELNSSNIESAKIAFKFNNEDKSEYQIASICDGYLRLLDTAFSDDVKSINTEDFKKWTSELESINEGSKLDILNTLKEHIANIESEITKENVSSEMEYIYTILLNFKNM